MIGQRHGDAVLQRGAWKGSLSGNGNLAIANKGQRIAIMGAPGLDQTGLTMNEQADRLARFIPAEADRRAAFRFVREVRWLAPFESLFQPADPLRLGRCLKDQVAERVQTRARLRRACVEDLSNAGRWLWDRGGIGQLSAPFLRRFACLWLSALAGSGSKGAGADRPHLSASKRAPRMRRLYQIAALWPL